MFSSRQVMFYVRQANKLDLVILVVNMCVNWANNSFKIEITRNFQTTYVDPAQTVEFLVFAVAEDILQ